MNETNATMTPTLQTGRDREPAAAEPNERRADDDHRRYRSDEPSADHREIDLQAASAAFRLR